MLGCPIRKSADQLVFANPRSLSQLITSFFASKSQGILHTPLITFSLPGIVIGYLLSVIGCPITSARSLYNNPEACSFCSAYQELVFWDGFLPSFNRFSDLSARRHLSVVTLLISQSKVALVSYSICQRTFSPCREKYRTHFSQIRIAFQAIP